MFSAGFLGTSAPFYMDLVTLYFALLPLLLGVAISFAVRGLYDTHYRMQLSVFVLTLLMVVVFEVGVRISGGFLAFMEQSQASHDMMVLLLVVHILVALISVVLWSALIYGAIKRNRIEALPMTPSHRKVGYYVFGGMSLTAIMGVSIYYFLFVYAQ